MILLNQYIRFQKTNNLELSAKLCLALFIVALSTTVLKAQSVTWVSQIGGAGNQLVSDVEVDVSGNVYSIGATGSSAISSFNPGALSLPAQTAGAYVTKSNSSGTFLWATPLSASGGTNFCTTNSIAVDNTTGDVYVVGQFQGTASFGGTSLTALGAQQDGFVCKLNSSGVVQWVKGIGAAVGLDYASNVSVDAGGNIIIAGIFKGTVDFDFSAAANTITVPGAATNNNGYLLKITSSSAFVWVKQIGRNASVVNFKSMILDATGNIYVNGSVTGTGDFDPGAGTTNLSGCTFISKFSNVGNLSWAKGIVGTIGLVIRNLTLDSSNDVYVTGTFSGTNIDFDPDPTAGVTYNLTSNTASDDVFILKLTNAGIFSWVKTIGGSAWEMPGSIAFDPTCNSLFYTFFVWENFFHAVPASGTSFDIDPGVATTTATLSVNNLVVSKLDMSGNLTYYGVEPANYNGGTMVSDKQGSFIVATRFINTPDFDPSSTVLSPYTATAIDSYILKILDNTAAPIISNTNLSCANTTATLSVSSGTNPVLWSTGSFTGAINPSTVSVAGNYTATATGANGCSTTSVVTVTQNTATPIITSAIADGNFNCTSITATLTAISGTNTLQWDGSSLSNAPNQTTVTAIGDYTVTATSDNGCTTTSVVTVANCSILPIELIKFNASCNQQDVNLNWSTATELNNNYFSLERSFDAANWQKLVKINGAGNSLSTKEYAYVDSLSSLSKSDIVYYRLSQTDYNGTSKIYPLIYTSCFQINNVNDVTVFPNPAADVINIHCATDVGASYSIQVYSSIGVLVLDTTMTDNSDVSVNLSAFSKGLYNFHITKGSTSILKKIVLQ